MTRRSLLQGTGAALAVAHLPLLTRAERTPPCYIAHEDHLLATESARGYSQVLTWSMGKSMQGCSIVAGLRSIAERDGYFLVDALEKGKWILVESGLSFATASECSYHHHLMRELFGLQTEPPVNSPDLNDLYVTYEWPVRCMVRNFGGAVGIDAEDHEVIARAKGMPIAVRKTVGKGGIIYIGTPLGPLIPSGDAEAIALARALAGSTN